MMTWLVFSGWMGNGSEAVFVEAPTKGTAIVKALALFNASDAKREFSAERMSAEPLQLNVITECDGWTS